MLLKCPTPYKRRYASKADCKFEIKRIRRYTGDRYQAPYVCVCGWWHSGHKQNDPKHKKLKEEADAEETETA